MDQNQRKFIVLNAIIREYIETAEPIGSRTLEKKHKLGVSSATIRNEMADLEEMGFLVQPHTSAGRIPSEKAYRLYVDSFMNSYSVDENIERQVKNVYENYLFELNNVVEHALNILTKLTNYTSILVSPNIQTLNLKSIKLVLIDLNIIMIVLVTKEGIIKNEQVRLSINPTNDEIITINNVLSHLVKDFSLEELSKKLEVIIDNLNYEENTILAESLPTIKSMIKGDVDIKLYSKGVSKIFNYPEFNTVDKAKNFVEAINRKENIKTVLSKNNESDINIKIGSENEIADFENCSVITANYKLNGKNIGTIGVIGPTRMNYDYAVGALDLLSKELTNHVAKIYKK